MSNTTDYWEARYKEEGFAIQHKELVGVDTDFVRTIKQGSYDYLEQLSRDLKKKGEVPEFFTTKTLQNAKRGKIQFCRAFSLALILREEAKAIGKDIDLKRIIVVDQVKNSEGNEVSVSRDIYKDLEIWINVVGYFSLLTSVIYVLAIFFRIPMDVAFPIIGISVSGLSAVVAYKKSKFPMPFNLRIVSGLFYGIITGGLAFYAHSLIQPESLCEFSTPLKQAAGASYICGSIIAFFAGKSLFINSKDNLARALVIGAVAFAVFSVIFGLMAPSC